MAAILYNKNYNYTTITTTNSNVNYIPSNSSVNYIPSNSSGNFASYGENYISYNYEWNNYRTIDLSSIMKKQVIYDNKTCPFCNRDVKIQLNSLNDTYYICFNCIDCKYVANTSLISFYGTEMQEPEIYNKYIELSDGEYIQWQFNRDNSTWSAFHSKPGYQEEINIDFCNDKQKILDKLNMLITFK